MVCAARNKEEISSRSSGWVSSARRDCSICARHSSVSSRNDCNNIARLISMTPLQILDYGFARIRVENDSLPAVKTNVGRNHGDMSFREKFQGNINVSCSEMI